MPSTSTPAPTTHSWAATHAENTTASNTTHTTTNGAPETAARRPLPSASAPSLTLRRTTAAERARLLRLNGASWRGALPLEAYVRREAHLAAQEMTRDGGWAPWVLVDDDEEEEGRGSGKSDGANGCAVDGGEGRTVLASCETYRRRALVADARSGIVRDVWAQGVGSVYCPAELRGRGYAGRLMRELVLGGGRHGEGGHGEEACEVSVLFSDIGKTFYAKYGWKPHPAAHLTLPARPQQDGLLPAARPLLAADLPPLCLVDEARLRASLERAAPSLGGASAFALLPDVQTMRWHHAREEFVGRELHGCVPAVKGAVVDDVDGSGRVWCCWTRMWYNDDARRREGNTLHVLRLVVEGKDVVDWELGSLSDGERRRVAPRIAALLAAAQREAAEWNLEGVEVWNPNAVTVEAARLLHAQVEVCHRDEESIPSLRWKSAADNVVWLGNEKYVWC